MKANKTEDKTKKKMKKRIKIPLIIVGVIVLAFAALFASKFIMTYQEGINMFTGERVNSEEYIAANSSAPEVELIEEDMFSQRDLAQEPDAEVITELLLVSGEDTVIDAQGTYSVSGDYTDTTIIVEADEKDKVQLVFDGLNIENKSKPAVYVKSADKVFITTTDTQNNVSVTADFEADGETNLDAVVYSKSDLVLNGIGSLDINSQTGNGVSTKDDLKITGGTYMIKASMDGLEANDSIRIYDGEITVNCDNDALQSINDEDENLGYIYIENGVLNISAGDDAIRGNSAVTINGGEININICAEGIEATQIRINGGVITMYATDDGINATGKTSHRIVAEINDGILNVSMAGGDTDAIDSNGDLTINGGEINIDGGMAAFDIDALIAFNEGDVIVDGVAQTEIKTQQIGFMNRFGNQ